MNERTVKQSDQLILRHGGANFDSYGIPDAAEIFHMGAADLPCTVSNPEEVRGCVVVVGRRPPREGFFIVQHEALMTANDENQRIIHEKGST